MSVLLKRIMVIAQRLAVEQFRSYESLNDATRHDDVYTKGDTEIWYAKDMYDWDDDNRPDLKNLKETHVLLGKIKERNLNKIYAAMQGEEWSPGGEARQLIRKLGLDHTSISVGDIIKVGGKYYFVAEIGFRGL